MFKLFISTTIYFSFIFISFADHGPKKMWKRQIKPYFSVHETKKFGPFKIIFIVTVKNKILIVSISKKKIMIIFLKIKII